MIRYGAWQIGFFSAGSPPARPDLFGCSTLGAVTGRQFHSQINSGVYAWGDEVRGCVYSGTYHEVLCGVGKCAFRPSFLLAFFARREGSEEFLQALRALMPDPSVAGGVAYGRPAAPGELSPAAEDVVILLPESAMFTTDFINPLEARGGIYAFDADSPRVLRRLRQPDMPWEAAGSAIGKLRESYKMADEDAELLALSDQYGRNIRLRGSDDGVLASEIFLPEEGYLHARLSDRRTVIDALIEYAQIRQTLVIADSVFSNLLYHPFSVPESTTVVYMPAQIAGGKFSNLVFTAVKR